MKTLLLIVLAGGLTGCASVPIAASYTGHAAGHEFSVGYSGKSGVGIVVSQK